MSKRISILGATGSIGDSTLDLVASAPEGSFDIVALTGGRNADKLIAQAKRFKPACVAIADESLRGSVQDALSGLGIDVLSGEAGLIEAAARPTDFVVAAITGSAGLRPTMAAVEQGATIGLANKECLVCAGPMFMQAIKANGATLLPIDSEHNAIFQVLDQTRPEGVRRLILTASGGPFRTASIDTLRTVTRADALNHPVWSMGAKISIDSATLMNKGLELIEASYLFDRPSPEIDVIVHPQSIVHSMVEYIDGSVLSQMGSPDMKTPIAYAMAWPERMEAPVERLDFAAMGALEFYEPDLMKFPLLALARTALEAGGNAPNIINAANEIAVAAFLQDDIRFLDIHSVVAETLDISGGETDCGVNAVCVDSVMTVDKASRNIAKAAVKRLA